MLLPGWLEEEMSKRGAMRGEPFSARIWQGLREFEANRSMMLPTGAGHLEVRFVRVFVRTDRRRARDEVLSGPWGGS